MYHDHFALKRAPFSIAPDPRFLYMSERHREALAHLKWGLAGAGGFVLLTGEVGTGKTTLCRCLLRQVPDDTEVAFVINPRLTVSELLTTICEELGDPPPTAEQASVKRLVDRINHHLLGTHARGGRVVLVVDEAQNLSFEVLEQLRLLTNLETDERKLLQVILLGQPELAAMLAAPELRQLAQRITARYHLPPLSETELTALVRHRLAVAGARRNPFTADALRALHAHSQGIPRIANVIADRALLGAYAEDTDEIPARIVHRAAREVLGEVAAARPSRRPGRRLAIAAGLVLAAALGATGSRLLVPAPAVPTGPASATEDPAPGPAAATAAASAVRSGPLDSAEPTATDDERAPGTTLATPSRAAVDPRPAPVEAPVVTALDPLWSRSFEAARAEAARALLEAWYAPVPVEENADPCTQIAAAGLRCLREQGSWSLLADLDRPAMLELWRADAPRPRHLALLASAGDAVTVRLDGRRRVLDRTALDALWRGGTIVFWQMPPAYERPSRRGDDDATSAWLTERLALLDGGPGGTGTFDAELEARVRAFQLEAGLRPDGIAGPRTWMRLNDATGLAAPGLGAP